MFLHFTVKILEENTGRSRGRQRSDWRSGFSGEANIGFRKTEQRMQSGVVNGSPHPYPVPVHHVGTTQ